MILTRVVPTATAQVESGDDYGDGVLRVDLSAPDAREHLSRLYSPPPGAWLRVNSVLSVGGSVQGPDGSSDGLTSPSDRFLMRVIRSQCDVVLTGAASVRREGLNLPTDARLAIVTGSGDLGGLAVPEGLDPGRVIVLCPASAVSRVEGEHASLQAEIVAVDAVGSRIEPLAVVAALHARGLLRIVCEGGPTLVAGLVLAGLVDELCLTTSPSLTPATAPLIPGRGPEQWPLTLTQLLVDEDGMLFARWLMVEAVEADGPAGGRP